jgi:hypothetical protein
MPNLRAMGTLTGMVGDARNKSGIRDRRSSAQLERDHALERVGLTRRIVIGGAGALTAGITALVWAIAPGHTLGASTRPSASGASTASTASATPSTSVSSNRMPPLATPSQLGLVAGAAPQPAPAQPSAPAQSSQAPSPVQAAPVQAPPVSVAPAPVVSGGS